MPDIFLSYGRRDQATAGRFADAFARAGLEVWWDPALRSGETFDEVIESALRSAKAVVVLWSRSSVASRWVRAEATLADRNRTLVPALIEACERPIIFELTHTADLAHWQGDESDRAWLGFLSDVRRMVAKDGPAAQQGAASPAPLVAIPRGERGDKPSLAVMPFVNRSGRAEDDAIAFGMVEDIVAAISLSPDVRVLASSATIAWRDKPADLRAVGRDIGARYILEGNVRRAGTNLRVTVQLVEAESGAILWTQRFDRPLSELADLQEELVTEVAGNLGIAVANLEMDRALKKPQDITAYEALQRAMASYASFSLAGLPTAIAEVRRALAIDSDYALAHGMLGFALGVRFFWTGSLDEASRQESLEHVERALALEPRNPEISWGVAGTLVYLGRPRDAMRHAERALDLNPGHYHGRRHLASALICLGRNDEALEHLDVEERLGPRNVGMYASLGRRAIAHFQAGRLQPAIDAMERAFRWNPGFPNTLVLRAGLCTLAGRADDARDAIRDLRRVDPATDLDLHARRLGTLTEPRSIAPLLAAFSAAWDATGAQAGP